MFLRCLSVVTVFMLILPCAGCGKSASKREKYIQTMLADQGKYQQLSKGQEVNGERASEAKSWLEFTNTQNVLRNSGRQQTQGIVNDLYDAGAPRVLCIFVTVNATFRANMCSSLLIEMPKDAEKRKEVLKAFAKAEKEFWKGAAATKVTDEGQSFLHLNMDP